MTNAITPTAIGSNLFVGYVPAFRDVVDWKHVYRTDRPAAGEAIVRRVILENADNRDERILVDVTETASPEEALHVLRTQVAENSVIVTRELDKMTDSFQFPTEAPRSKYFLRANLAIWVFSCGRYTTPVQPWVDRIFADLHGPRSGVYDSALRFEPIHGSPEHFHYSLKWTLGEWGWFKFEAERGTLTRGPTNTLSVRPEGHPTVVRGWAIEPGRETYQGSITLATVL